MPRSERKLNKRRLDECRSHTAWINYHLEIIAAPYKEIHPDWYERFNIAIELNKTLDDLLLKLNEEL